MDYDIDQVIINAIEEVDTRKHPRLEEFREVINPIAKAIGEGSVDDKIELIQIYNDTLEVYMSYDVRQCQQNRKVKIPMSVINSENPVEAAVISKAEKKLNEARNKMNEALKSVHYRSNEYDKALTALNQLKGI